MFRTGARAAAILLLAVLSGCAAMGPAPCPPGAHEVRTARLFFGRNIGERLGVSDADFDRFLDDEVTPRFPDGLSVYDAQGRWRSGAVTVREPAKVVEIVLPGKAGDAAQLSQLAAAYKQRFHQEAVLVLTESACAAF
jgi:hypothetical protein